MNFEVIDEKREGEIHSFRVKRGFRLFGVWFRPGKEPLVQKIVIPLDESATNRFINVSNEATRQAVLKAVERFTESKYETT